MKNRPHKLLALLARTALPEPPSEVHDLITPKVIQWVTKHIQPNTVLDIGCGQGVAMKEFQRLGIQCTGTTLTNEDLKQCLLQGLDVRKADMHHDLHKLRIKTVDLVWCRHVLEHSPFPLLAMREMLRNRAVREAWFYFEFPSPDTASKHETNPNHYSVFTPFAWRCLLERHFRIVDAIKMQFQTMLGPDEYFGFLCQQK